jgi:hypothetical protein
MEGRLLSVRGLFARDDHATRLKFRRGFLVLLTVFPASLFLSSSRP